MLLFSYFQMMINIQCNFCNGNNITLLLNKPVASETILDLLNYKRILMYKYCNPNYAGSYSVNMIASKIKLLKFK